MEHYTHIQPPKDSSILAYGQARSSWRFWISLVGAMALLAAAVLLGSLLFSKPMIPEKTALLIVIRPRVLAPLFSEETRDALPAPWRIALASHSRWNALVGAWRDDDGWRTFAVVPRWHVPTAGIPSVRTAGWYATIGDRALSAPERPFRFSEAAEWGTSRLSSLKLWVDPGRLHDASASVEGLAPLTASLTDRTLETDLEFETPPNVLPLTDADVSLRLTSAIQRLVHVGDLIPDLPETTPMRLDLLLDQTGAIAGTALAREQPWTADEAARLLSGFGLVSRRQIQLEDGTVVTEQTPLALTDGRLAGNWQTARFGTVALATSTLRFGKAERDLQPLLPACPEIRPLVRLSSQALTQITKNIVLSAFSSSWPGLQIGIRRNKLIFCLES